MTESAFTPDATFANKSRVVGRLNILSLLASFARENNFTQLRIRVMGGASAAASVLVVSPQSARLSLTW